MLLCMMKTMVSPPPPPPPLILGGPGTDKILDFMNTSISDFFRGETKFSQGGGGGY